MEYRMAFERDTNGTILVSFPDFPEAHTFGADKDEARARAVDALETAIEAYMQDRRAMPAPSKAKRGEELVTLPAIVALKVGLYATLLETKITKYALAKKLGWHTPQVDRLFDLRHQSKLEQIEQAAAALGRSINVELVKAG